MTTNNPDLDLFARVKDGAVVEFPVRRIHIQNRAQPIVWYTPAVEKEKPALPPFHYYVTNFEISGEVVTVSYEVKPYTLQELLGQLRNDQPAGISEIGPITIDKVDAALVERVMKLISDFVTDRLLEFAATRTYGTATADPFISASTYTNSKVPKFRLESQYLLDLRDDIWINLIEYQTRVLAGELPVPTSIDDVLALFPEMVWPEVPIEVTPAV